MNITARKARKSIPKGRRNNSLRAEMLEPRMMLSGDGLVHDFYATVGPQLEVNAECAAPMPVALKQANSQTLASASPAAASISYSTLPNGLPILNSYANNPSHATIFLDFDGDEHESLGVRGSLRPGRRPDELQRHRNRRPSSRLWRETTVYFAMFDVNVTTIQPDVSTTPTIWVVPNPNGFGNWCNGKSPIPTARSSFSRTTSSAECASSPMKSATVSATGHTSEYDTWGNKIAEYADEFDPLHGPMMGVDFAGVLHKWTTWHDTDRPHVAAG